MNSSVRIIIVEDEPMIRHLLRLFCEIEPTWHVVGEAGDCASACSMVEAMRPDIVLLDVNLGAENGLDCLPQLLELGARRVLILTGNSDPKMREFAFAAGACDVLYKGDPSEKIRSAIREHAASTAQVGTMVLKNGMAVR
jgi:DNA-binding NarL/FixJ family response regulator